MAQTPDKTMHGEDKISAAATDLVIVEPTKSNVVGEVQDVPGEGGLKRSLSQRHLMMLAIGGVIGPGYFVGMGNGLSSAGPAGLLLCFAIVGILLWAVMQSFGELGAYIAASGSFTHYTSRLVDPSWGFALGWNYWFLWAGIIMAEYNNLGLILGYWQSDMPRWGWILVFWFVFLAFTFLGVWAFGEVEFWLSLAKVIFIVAFFISAILISTGGIGGEEIGFKFYNDPGPFANGVKGVFEVFVFAALQYSGTEMIGLTAGESTNPARDVPKAVKSVLWRIVVIFIGGIFFLTITVPYNDSNLLHAGSKTARSPFVIALTRVGANAGGSVVNAVILVTIFSAINGSLYVGSRTLYGLAVESKAPKILAWTNKRGVPVPALVSMNLIGFLSLLNPAAGAGTVYQRIVNMTGVATFITWCLICLCQIRLRRALQLQGFSIDVLPFKAPWYPYVAYFGLIGNIFFIFFQGWTSFAPWDIHAFFMNYVVIILFIVLVLGHKVTTKSSWVRLKDADIVSERRTLPLERD
ncbi:amino acid permease-like protein, partial [Aureobasidium melanogenum]